MILSQLPFLTCLIFLPLFGSILIGLIPGRAERWLKGVSFVASLLPLGILIYLFMQFSGEVVGFQFKEQLPWFPALGMEYRLGMDGLSLLLVGLTTLITPVALAAGFMQIRQSLKWFLLLMLWLETGMFGVFLSLDLILFFLFWEVTLIPMYFLIGLWGGARRIYASFKFVLYTMAGSTLLFFSILGLSFFYGKVTGHPSFAFEVLLTQPIPPDLQVILFVGFSLAFAVKVPIFPFHTWLPDAHVEAPTVGSVILAGVLLKMGTYGFLRFAFPLFPDAFFFFAPYLAVLALIGIVYGALVALAQQDMKSLVAYSSVSHLGFVMLGMVAMNEWGLSGSILQMVNHGLSTGGLFLLVGFLYERRHTREIAAFGGLSQVMPIYWVCFLLMTLASIGLPGFNGFIGEFLILLGAFTQVPWWGTIGGLGVILGAVYMLWLVQRVFHGPLLREENKALSDLKMGEVALLLPLFLFILWMGLYPNTFLQKLTGTNMWLMSRTTHSEVVK